MAIVRAERQFGDFTNQCDWLQTLACLLPSFTQFSINYFYRSMKFE
jgi:hypothetical protein